MKFLVDAQLPRSLVKRLNDQGYVAIHTLDLPLGNRTPDAVINELSINEQYIIITKDADFVISFVMYSQPWKLLLVSTGNIKNTELESLFLTNLVKIEQGFDVFNFIELDRTSVIFHS